MRPHTSLSERLPYWGVVTQQVRGGADGREAPLSFLILKDGTVSLGLEIKGSDVYAADNARLNQNAALLSEAFAALKAGMYCQQIFETSRLDKTFLEDFRAQGGGGRGHTKTILSAGRAARYSMLRKEQGLRNARIYFWIGHKQVMATSLSPRRAPRPSLQTICRDLIACFLEIVSVAKQLGFSPRPLGKKDVEKLCADAVNLREAHDDELADSACDATERRGTGCPLPPHATLATALARSFIRASDTSLAVGDPPLFLRSLTATRLGTMTDAATLHEAMYANSPKLPFRICITHEATDTEVTRDQISRRLRFISSFVGKHFINHEAKSALDQNDTVLNAMETAGKKIFDTSITVAVTGYTVADLDVSTRRVIDGFRKHRIAMAVPTGHQISTWLATLPAYGFRAYAKHRIFAMNCAHLSPYWIPDQGDRSRDLVFANRQSGLEALSVRLGPVRENAGAIIVGGTGSGKTFLFSHLFKYGCLDQGGHVVLADMKGPQNSSYRPLCELLGGEYICLDSDRDVSFNPFPPHREVFTEDRAYKPGVLDAAERILCMMAASHLLEHDDCHYAQAVARAVIRSAYEAELPGQAQITLSSILRALERYQDESAKAQKIAHDMRDRLEVFLRDEDVIRLFNRPKPLDIDNRFTVFDFFKMNERAGLAGILISVLASRIEAKMTSLPKNLPKLFGFDEAWALFQQSKAACALLDRLYRVARSYGAFCYVMTQTIDDVAQSAAGNGIMSNTSMVFLMRHLSNHRKTAAALELGPRQEKLFRDLKMVPGHYSEFLLVDRHEDKTHLLQYRPTSFDLWCDTSRPSEVTFRQERFAQEQEKNPSQVLEQLAEEFPQGLSESTIAGDVAYV